MGFVVRGDVLKEYIIDRPNKTAVIPSCVKSIGREAFCGCNALTKIVIPKRVTSIAGFAFWNCSSLTNIVLPNGLDKIEESTFEGCSSLSSILIPGSVTSIGDSAFEGCSSLKCIVIPGSVARIGERAFGDCSNLTSVVISEGVKIIENNAFDGCSHLTSIIIPESVKYTEGTVYSHCEGLTQIVYPDSPSKRRAFLEGSIQNKPNSNEREPSTITPWDATKIEEYEFCCRQDLVNIIIPDSVTSIGDHAFGGCSSLTNVTIPNGVTYIGKRAFQSCHSLTTIVIPEGVTCIGDYAFVDCVNLTTITLDGGLASIGENVFWGCLSLKEIIGFDSLLLNGCNIHGTTMSWLLQHMYVYRRLLKETAMIYLTQPEVDLSAICKRELFDNCSDSAEIMTSLIQTLKDNPSALKKAATFVLHCGTMISTQILRAMCQALQDNGVLTGTEFCEDAIKNIAKKDSTVDNDPGYPIETVCLEQCRVLSLEQHDIPPAIIEGVHLDSSDAPATDFVVKCAILKDLYKFFNLPMKIGADQLDIIKVEPTGQINDISDMLVRNELRFILERFITGRDPIYHPQLLTQYCQYSTGKQINALVSSGTKWTICGDYLAKNRYDRVVVQGAMLRNEFHEAVFLIDKCDLKDEMIRAENNGVDSFDEIPF